MPIHDWTRVPDGTWHAFHLSWLSAIQEALNEGRLPARYYAQAEQIAGPMGPDVLALEEREGPGGPRFSSPSTDGGLALATAAPPLRATAEMVPDDYVLKRRTVVIRHVSGSCQALLEIASPGNKASRFAFRSFVKKAAQASYRGYHLSLVDLFPPGPRDPGGIHAAIWRELGEDNPYLLPDDEPLTLAAYSSGARKKAYIEPTAVGRPLIDLPLFLTDEGYVNVPLEATYQAAYRGVPRRWKEVLEAPPS
jgi:hypothetical protein